MVRNSRRFMAVIIMFTIIVSVGIIVFLPPYEKMVYSNSTEYEYDEILEDPYGYEGCRAGESVPVIDASDESWEEKMDAEEFFVLKADAKSIEPMGIYRPASCDTPYNTYETNSLKAFFLRAKESYAQYYMVTMGDGQQMPILVNDRMVKVPRKGEAVFPIGSVSYDSNIEKLEGMDSFDNDRFVDVTSGFERSSEMQKFYSTRMTAAVILWIVLTVGVMIVMIMKQVNRRR